MALKNEVGRSEKFRRKARAKRLGVSVHELTDPRGRHGKHARAAANARWAGGDTMRSSGGYILVRVGPDHPLAMGAGYAYMHEVVWVSAGRALPEPGSLLHHIDHDKDNNRLDNLEILTRPEHGLHHAMHRDRDEVGRFT